MNLAETSLNCVSLEAADANDSRLWARPGQPVGILHASYILEKGHRAMTKTMDVINEAVKDPKHPFRKIDNQPKKALKHRYERRKIKEYLHLADWLTEEAV
jgi:hypothetical protein